MSKLVHGERHPSLDRRILARDDGVVLVEGDNGMYAWVAELAAISAVYGRPADQAGICANLRALRRAEIGLIG